MIEGPDLVEAALGSGVEFEALFVDLERADVATAELVGRAGRAGVRTFALESAVFARVADTKTPQALLASVRLPVTELNALSAVSTLLVLCDVQDPGNAGTLIRSSDASGASAVVFCGQSVDPFNPKTLRASAGSVFHVPIVVADFNELRTYCRREHVQIVASVARGGVSPREADLAGPSALLVGNEATGLSSGELAAADLAVTIPMVGSAESLNAGVAGSLLAFEAMYQRGGAANDAPRSSL
ncbi:MAG TPA: RNA methyltransferase [Acidimicrobiales bacterium]|nr:RNA methyltransferase [Acidimicrobiales bacterium]